MFKDEIKGDIKEVGGAIQKEPTVMADSADEQAATAKLPGSPRPKLHLSHHRKLTDGARPNSENSDSKEIPAAGESVSCKICMKEIPISEAVVPEATEYVAHFCGIDCYDKWRKQPGNPFTQEDIQTSSSPL